MGFGAVNGDLVLFVWNGHVFLVLLVTAVGAKMVEVGGVGIQKLGTNIVISIGDGEVKWFEL